jgi:predicted membrane channel-forming protein YqfA (hemolysin III family)
MSSIRVNSSFTRPNGRRLLQAGLLTIVAAVVANLVVRLLVGALTPIDPAFLPLGFGAITAFTVLGVALGAVVYALIARRAANPARTFTVVAVVALVVSILPNLALMANPAAAPMPGGTAAYYGLLILFHIVAGVVAIVLLPRLGRG